MKRLIFLLFLLIPSLAFGVDVTLEWDANTEPDVVGYRLYKSMKQGNVTTAWELVGHTSETTYTIIGLPNKTHFFYVTAYTLDNEESQASNLAFYKWKPGTIKNLRTK
jgi:hypothetical protein